MKNIEVTDEVYSKLLELSNEMRIQDPRGTRAPHLFQIEKRKKVYDWGLNGEFQIFVDRESAGSEIEEFEDLIHYLENIDFFKDADHKLSLTAELKEKWDCNWGWYDMEDWVSENAPELERCSYSWDYIYENAFFTAKACQEHIQRNHYHYNQPRDYLNHAWRNPEMELIHEFLIGLTNVREEQKQEINATAGN